MATRALAVLALVAAAALLAWTLARGDGTYTVMATLDDAGQLVTGNDVRVGAASVGEVASVDLGRDGRAHLTLRIRRDRIRLRSGTRLAVRSTSLTGSANHYVVLTPGGLSEDVLPDGAQLPATAALTAVNVDQLLNTLDAPTRAGLRDLIAGGAQLYGSRTAPARAALDALGPALGGTGDVLRSLARDQRATGRLVAAGAITAKAVAEERDALARSVEHTATAMSAIADERVALSRSLRKLPRTLSGAQTTLTGLRSAMDQLDPVVAVARPATRDLAPWLGRLRPLLGNAVPTLRDLASSLAGPGRADDLVDLTRSLPAVARAADGAAPRAVKAMNRSQDIADALLAYTPDLAGTATRLTEVAGAYDANGHYLRAQPALFAMRYDGEAGDVLLQPNADRLRGLSTNPLRCPGAAEPDGSLATRVGGCILTSKLIPAG